MKKSLKKILSFALVLLMLVGMTACAGTPAADTSNADAPNADTAADETPAEKRVLRVAGESWQVTKIFLEDAAAAFMEAHPDVTVEVITYADTSVLSTYSLDWANGTTDVDLVFLDGTMYAQQFAAKGLISDWETDLKFFDNYSADNFVENVVDFGRINDSLVLMPIIYEVNGINVNIPMFKEAGLVDADGNPLQPETWEEFYEFAKKLTIVDESGAVIQQGASINFGGNMMSSVASTLAAANGRIVGDDGITMDFDNENFREILAIWKQGVADGYFPLRHLPTRALLATPIRPAILPCALSPAPAGWKQPKPLASKMFLFSTSPDSSATAAIPMVLLYLSARRMLIWPFSLFRNSSLANMSRRTPMPVTAKCPLLKSTMIAL